MDPSFLSPDWIPIASFLLTCVDLKAIEQALGAAHVPFRTEGSRATQILVAHDDARRAVEVLERSSFASHIHFYPSIWRAEDEPT